MWKKYRKIDDSNISFYLNFIELIEIIYFRIFLEIPILLEGENGQGKKTAINYISDCLGYELLILNYHKILK